MKDFPQSDSLVPIFLDDGKPTTQVATGVAIKLADEIFILSAAHVTDLLNHGALCVPTQSGVSAIRGGHGGVRLPRRLNRNEDKYDVAYFRLDETFAKSLHPDIRPLGRDDVHLHETLVEGDLYTFSGYPASKSKTRTATVSTELFSYTGCAASQSKYKQLGYDATTHILVNFNRSRSRTAGGEQRTPPHPRGISGGGVFSWPKDWSERPATPLERSLVAIGHTYLRQHNCLVGTRIHLHLSLIAKAFPHLRAAISTSAEPGDLPIFLALVWYPREEWEGLRRDFVDGDKYPRTWNEWRQRAETGLEELGKQGVHIVPIELSRTEIAHYCRTNTLFNDSDARVSLANYKLMKQVREHEL